MPSFTLDLGSKVDELLTNLAKEQETTKSDVIRRALASYAYLYEQVKTAGRKVAIADENDRVIKEIVLP